MSETNGKSNGKPLNKRDKNGKIVKGAVLNPKGRGKGTLNQITKELKECLGDGGTDYLLELKGLSQEELKTRRLALGVFQQALLNASEKITPGEFLLLIEGLKTAMPAAEITKVYSTFLLRIIPQEKNVNVNIDKRERFLVTLLGLKGKDSLDAYEAYLTDDLKELNGGHENER